MKRSGISAIITPSVGKVFAIQLGYELALNGTEECVVRELAIGRGITFDGIQLGILGPITDLLKTLTLQRLTQTLTTLDLTARDAPDLIPVIPQEVQVAIGVLSVEQHTDTIDDLATVDHITTLR